MKKWIGPAFLGLLAVAAIYSGIAVHEWAVPFNCLPIAVWVAVILLGQRRWASLGDPISVILGLMYGALAGTGGGAFFLLVITAAMENRYYRNPYDMMAFSIILLLTIILFVVLAIVDYVKTGFKPLWVRLVTVLVTFFPCMLMAMQIMAYFEEKLSHLVK